MEYKYDSKADTLEHIRTVNSYLIDASIELLDRAKRHDQSKMLSPEKELFDKYTPELKDLVFGSPEYRASLSKLKPALDNHYANNSHHPQHYADGINGMNLYDIIEMFLDWKAAGKRNKDGNIFESIEVNSERFNMSPQLKQIFINTANYEH